MPIGRYADFEACVRDNQDKESPEGYCASIEKKITGEWPGVNKMDIEKNAKTGGYPNPGQREAEHKPEPSESLKSGHHPGSIEDLMRRRKGLEKPSVLPPDTIKKAIAFVSKSPIEAHGVKGMQSKPWRKTFKTSEQMVKWADQNQAEVHATRDVE